MNNQIIAWLNNNLGCNLSADYYNNISLWENWWQGYNEPFHKVRYYDGKKIRTRKLYTLKMAKKVCEDWAAILINDKTFIKVDDEYSSTFLQGDSETEDGGVFGSNNFWDQANDLMEQMMWSGTAAIVIRLKNAAVDSDGRLMTSEKTRIDLDYLPADKIIVLSANKKLITEAAFCSEIFTNGKKSIYLEIHRLIDHEYVIENHMFEADPRSDDFNKEVELPEGVAKVIRTGSDKPWFCICKPAIVNSIKNNNGMGCSVFANATDVLEGIDLAYNNFNSDWKLGQKKVFMHKSMLDEMSDGTKVTPDDVGQQLFYYIGESFDDKEKSLIQEHNPDLRVEDNTKGIQAQLDYLSFKVGFGTKHYQFNNGSIVTATQYIGDKQDLVQNAHKHFGRVRRFLNRLVKTILWIGHNYVDPQVKESCKITVVFDQSPLIDENAERQRDKDDVTAGLLQRWEFRVKWYGETERQAKDRLADGELDDDELMGFDDDNEGGGA